MLSWQPPLWTVINSRITRTLRQLRRPDSKKNGSPFSERLSFLGGTVAFPFARDEVEGPASAAKKLSAFFVSASIDRRARYCTVETRGEAEVPTALIVAITLAFAMGAQAQTGKHGAGDKESRPRMQLEAG
jgi:hypothetical protein